MEDIDQIDFARGELPPLIEKVWRHCQSHRLSGKTVTLKVKYSDFEQATRSRTVNAPVSSGEDILEIANQLLTSVAPFRKPVRLLGVTLSSLTPIASVAKGQLLLEL
ncbi:hypothetical protein [Rhizobium rhizogenes]|uniref:DinB/UmuC family translesion DNA polymerase n=1 Tax=Rhizobium rhizogenes TaxID=359 RepID=UPI001FCBFF0D